MSMEYDIWLQSLGSIRADMPVSVRGLAVSHTVTYPSDVTSATLQGSVKIAPDATSELAVFTVGTPAFDGIKTTWPISLTGLQTGGMPVDGDGDGVEHFVYDFLLALSGGEPQRIFGGLFPLSGFVTEPA